MSHQRKMLLVVLVLGLVVLGAGLTFGLAQAHGSMGSPISRVYNCYLEGPESPDSAACQAAIATGGTQAMYDWNGVRQGNANGNHKALIPDGKLCSANNTEFRGLDLARSDWVATTMTSGSSYTFRFRATAVHRGTMYLYITRNGYNPTLPLKWSDLEAAPFSSYTTGLTASGGFYSWTAQVPSGKSGRHLIYMIWQRSDSPEAFYSCSDVVFGGGGGGSTAVPTVPPTQPGPTATPSRTPTPVSGTTTWTVWTAYSVGQLVTYNGITYRCLQSHTSQPGWEPPNTAALWQRVN